MKIIENQSLSLEGTAKIDSHGDRIALTGPKKNPAPICDGFILLNKVAVINSITPYGLMSLYQMEEKPHFWAYISWTLLRVFLKLLFPTSGLYITDFYLTK